MAATLDTVVESIKTIKRQARTHGFQQRQRWPMIVLRTPKGWTGPKVIDGKPVEGTFRAHQVPMGEMAEYPEHMKILEEWMRSYKPQELFDTTGKLLLELAALAPQGTRRMGANPHANGGLLLRESYACPTSAIMPCPSPHRVLSRSSPPVFKASSSEM